jgi:hypothetical protein
MEHILGTPLKCFKSVESYHYEIFYVSLYKIVISNRALYTSQFLQSIQIVKLYMRHAL